MSKRRQARNRHKGRPPLNARQISAAHRAARQSERLAEQERLLNTAFDQPERPSVFEQLAYLNLLEEPCLECLDDHAQESLGCLHECHED